MSKVEKIELLAPYREENLRSNSALISKYNQSYEENEEKSVDLLNSDIRIKICISKEDKQMWKAYTLLTSSFPWRGSVGRQVKLFVEANDVILGMVHLTSPLAQMRVRDEFLNLSDKWREIQQFYNIETCMPTRKYAKYRTGKLLVYCVFSKFCYALLEDRYGSRVRGFEVTSLYGKSSMYNRIPFLKYLGTTDGLSAVYIRDAEWKALLDDYKSKFPDLKKNRLAPVKFQIIDKLANYYKSRNSEFPYAYQDIRFKRGVYVGMSSDHNVSLSESIEEWKKRWLLPKWNLESFSSPS